MAKAAIAKRDDDQDYSLAVVVPDFLQGIESKGILADVEIQQAYLRLSLDGERFTIMEGRTEIEELGKETTVRFLHVYPAIQRAQYEEDYESSKNNDEWVPPRCYSNDGIAPSEAAAQPLAKKCAECPFRSKETKAKGENTCSQFRNTVVQITDSEGESEPMLMKVGAMSHWTPPSRGDKEEMNFQRILKWADRENVLLEIYPVELQFDAAKEAQNQLTFIPVTNRPLVQTKADWEDLQALITDNATVFEDMCVLDFSNVGDNSEEKADTSEDEQLPKSSRKKAAAKEDPATATEPEVAEQESQQKTGGQAGDGEPAAASAAPARTRRTKRTRKPNVTTTPESEAAGGGEVDGDDDDLPDDVKALLGQVPSV